MKRRLRQTAIEDDYAPMFRALGIVVSPDVMGEINTVLNLPMDYVLKLPNNYVTPQARAAMIEAAKRLMAESERGR